MLDVSVEVTRPGHRDRGRSAARQAVRCLGSHQRSGPFDTEAEAAKALDLIAERNRRYDAEDAAWEG